MLLLLQDSFLLKKQTYVFLELKKFFLDKGKMVIYKIIITLKDRQLK